MEFSLHRQKYVALVLKVWLALVVALGISMYFFDYKMTNSDIPGGLLSGLLLAYLIHILQNEEGEEK